MVAVVRPMKDGKGGSSAEDAATKQGDTKNPDAPSSTSVTRELEVYVSPLEIARPQKAAFSTTNSDPAAHYQDSSTLYASVSDGTCYPKERWEDVHLRIKEVVRRVMGPGRTAEDATSPVPSSGARASSSASRGCWEPTVQTALSVLNFEENESSASLVVKRGHAGPGASCCDGVGLHV